MNHNLICVLDGDKVEPRPRIAPGAIPNILYSYSNKGVFPSFVQGGKKKYTNQPFQTETLKPLRKYARLDGPAWREPVSQLLKLNDVEERVCLKRAKIYALIECGDFPPPIKLSPGRSVWMADDIDGWINQRALESRKPVGGDNDQ